MAVYTADAGGRVLKETLLNGAYVQSTVQAAGVNVQGLAVDEAGDVFTADFDNNRVLKETPTTSGFIQTTALAGGLTNPRGITLDASGTLYIADAGANRIVKETPSGSGYVESTLNSGLVSPEQRGAGWQRECIYC
jgi:DNA-binding beta-propeller fold protein YncE